jgi:NAD(P)H-dependent nitrite reductase small subunit
MGFVKVASVNELKDGEGKVVEASGRKIALFRQGGRFYAIDNTCAHKGGPLGEGSLEGMVVSCPWHGWKFDISTGISPVNPAARVRAYEVRVEGEEVMVNV